MKKLLQLKTMLLLCALIVGSGSAWADTLVSGSGTSGYAVPTGWTSSGTIAGGSYLKFEEGSITSPAFAPHTSLSFTYTVATYGGGTDHPLTIRILDASTDEVLVEKTTATPTSSSYISTDSPLSLGDIYVNFKIQLYAPSGKGIRLRNYSITGTPSSAPAITVSKSSLSFGEVEATSNKEMTFTVTPSNLTAGLTLSTNNDLYTVSPKSIASNATGAQTITVTANPTSVKDDMDGKVIISGDDFDDDTEVSLSTTVIRKSAELSFSPTSVELTKGEEFTAPTFTKGAGINALDITFTTTYAGVATVSDAGVISLGGNTGTAIIRASFDQTDVYEEGVATCTITVNPAGVTPEPNAGGYYEKVTSVNNLSDGDKILIVYDKSYTGKSSGTSYTKQFQVAMGSISDHIGSAVDVTFTEENITDISTATEYTLEKVDDQWLFNAGSGYLYASGSTTSGTNYIDVTSDLESTNENYSKALASITISNTGDATITFNITGRNLLQFNPNLQSGGTWKPRFTCYSSAQQDVQLYKYVAGETPDNIDIYVSEAGLATYASNFDLDYSTNDNLKAYIAVEDGGEIKYEEVETVPAGTGVLLRALDTAGKNYSVGTTTATDDDKAAVADNKFVRGNDEKVASGTGPYNYILNVVNNQIGFYRAAEKTVAKNRAYLSTSIGAASARIDIFFDDDTNGIKKIENAASNKENGTFFNLAGQRVAQPSKGLYIVNGRKVIVK